MNDPEFRAGAAAGTIDPPLGLPMVGFVRRIEPARERFGSLEASAVAFERGSTRVVLCGVDTMGIQLPEADELRDRIAAATGAERAGILLNSSHTHHAPAGSRAFNYGERELGLVPAAEEYLHALYGRIVAVCEQACERLEPAWVRWGLGFVDEGVNRRRREPDGRLCVVGWNPDGAVDPSVPVLQATRPDDSVIATLIGYGCHTMTTGFGFAGYSPDFPGPMRDVVRHVTGGECIFFQAAGANVIPRFWLDDELREPQRVGSRLAVEALRAVADQPGAPSRIVEREFGSGSPFALYSREPVEATAPRLAAAEALVEFPLVSLPSAEEIEATLAEAEAEIEAAEARGASEYELAFLRYHGLNWARRAAAAIRPGRTPTSATGSIHAVRVGDGAIVTGPGETFTEIGLAVKERSPADVTLYAGYTNGLISYMAPASEYAAGGFEIETAHKCYGLPAGLAPETERILVETGVRLVRDLFPDRPTDEPTGWTASGGLPQPPARLRFERPPIGHASPDADGAAVRAAKFDLANGALSGASTRMTSQNSV